MSRNLLAFVTAAFLEIAGCFAFWVWLRREASPLVALLGVVSLIAFALTLTRVDSMFAGRAYAAYGGIYIRSRFPKRRYGGGFKSSRPDQPQLDLEI